MGKQEDAVEGLCILRAWAIQEVSMGYLEPCCLSQESSEYRALSETSDGSWIHPLSLSLASCEPVY